MMNYSKPVISVDSGLAEGVYMASGCYDASAYISQPPETGRDYYVIHVDAVHNADHTNEKQTLRIRFNQEVTYQSSQGALVGSGTGTELTIDYSYHNNGHDNIGFGDLNVKSNSGLTIMSVSMTDDYVG